MPGKGHDLESWDVVQSYRDPRPSDIPADAEKRHGYLDEAGRQHFVYVRTAPLTGTCVLCAARAS
ncbi:MAG: hypothetical protein KA761_15890 [Gemmatimonadaceae bacterium]|nr:hypothetical protein [Gemmatimonadaceae bacterium]